MRAARLLTYLLVGLSVFGQAVSARAGEVPLPSPCTGDCDGNDEVVISELLQGVTILLGSAMLSQCPAFDADASGEVGISELVQAVGRALHGCACPLDAGSYTITQVAGGTMRVATLYPFAMPPGGTLTLDLSHATLPDCVHRAVVPYPGGLQMPTFCIAATGFSAKLTQTGCGVGQIDSNGGSDYSITEVADTSDTSATCNLPNLNCANTAPDDQHDSSARVDVTVGDTTPAGCSAGTANALLTVPVRMQVWVDSGGIGYSCPAEDGTYDADDGDMLILEVSQILDFTTGATMANWADLDGDGCFLVGVGPADTGFFSDAGVCLDVQSGTVTMVASGTAPSALSPLRDTTYVTKLPNTFSGPGAPLNATCDTAPPIMVGGTVSRCIE